MAQAEGTQNVARENQLYNDMAALNNNGAYVTHSGLPNERQLNVPTTIYKPPECPEPEVTRKITDATQGGLRNETMSECAQPSVNVESHWNSVPGVKNHEERNKNDLSSPYNHGNEKNDMFGSNNWVSKQHYSYAEASSSRHKDSSAGNYGNYNKDFSTSRVYQMRQYQSPQPQTSTSTESLRTKPMALNQLPTSKPLMISSCEPTLSEDTAKRRLTASFKHLSLLLVTSAAKFPSSNNSGFDVMSEWEVTVNSMNLKSLELNNVAKELGNSLKCLQDFFTSFHAVDEYFGTSTYLASEQLKLLKVDLRDKLNSQLAKISAEGVYCSKLCNAFLNSVVSAISRKIEANRAVDELLEDNICKAAFNSYIDQIDHLLKDNIFTDKEVMVHHEKIVDAVLSSFSPVQKKVWEQRIKSLDDKMKSNVHDVVNRNKRNLSELRKVILSLLRTCQRDFDRLFSESTPGGDIKAYRDSILCEALKKANVDEQLQTVVANEVEQMMTTYAAT